MDLWKHLGPEVHFQKCHPMAFLLCNEITLLWNSNDTNYTPLYIFGIIDNIITQITFSLLWFRWIILIEKCWDRLMFDYTVLSTTTTGDQWSKLSCNNEKQHIGSNTDKISFLYLKGSQVRQMPDVTHTKCIETKR